MTNGESCGKISKLSRERFFRIASTKKDFEKSRKKYLTNGTTCGKIAELLKRLLEKPGTKNFEKS